MFFSAIADLTIHIPLNVDRTEPDIYYLQINTSGSSDQSSTEAIIFDFGFGFGSSCDKLYRERILIK